MNVGLCVIAATLGFCSSLSAETTPTVAIRGGPLSDGVLDHTIGNSGLVVGAGMFFEVEADLDGRDLGDAQVIELYDDTSWGEFFSGCSVQRELHSFVLAGIPAADALEFAAINAARALGVASQLGCIETGKLADLVLVTGNPLEDIRNTRTPLLVMKGGTRYDPAEILQSVVGTIGPRKADEEVDWMPRGRGG